ncbi:MULTISPECIES: VanZ family protein [Asticcacaulis]|jgi:VanZ family protein|nr:MULTISPECIES: VanZ family protein [Asticcacaulis]WKL58587.1 VanZ family protein [Asticcacaulis sp. ZE23SCel15]
MSRQSQAIFLVRTAVVLLAVILAVLMFGPFQGREQELGLSDKEAHVLAFFVLTLLAVTAFPRVRKWDVGLACLIVAGLSEIIQMFTGRSASLYDWLADATGVVMAIAPMNFAAWRAQMRGGKRWKRRATDQFAKEVIARRPTPPTLAGVRRRRTSEAS